MTPLGEHIRITKPEEVNKSYFIVEKEAVQKAQVISVSPDVKMPEYKTVFFWTDRAILIRGEWFLNTEMILGGYLVVA
jgi:hypothetical protein